MKREEPRPSYAPRPDVAQQHAEQSSATRTSNRRAMTSYRIHRRYRLMPVGLLSLLVVVACTAARTAAGAAPSAPSAPSGTVAFFDTTQCPTGWSVDTASQGRLLVATVTAADVGLTVNEPLSNKEDRTHDHKYSTTVHVPSKNISAFSSPANNQGAKQGNYGVQGTTQKATSELPFTQVLVCRKG